MGFADTLGPLVGAGMALGVDGDQGYDSYTLLLQKSMDEFGRIDPNKLREILAEQMGPSAMEGVAADPRLQQAQMAALGRLQEISSSGGMTVEDRARLNEIEGQANGAALARRQSILAGQRRRGGGGGGSELSAMLSGAANDSNAQAAGGYDAHAEGARRALQALQGGAALASGMRDQDFGEKSKIAGAKDRIGEFNARMRQEGQLANQQRDQQMIQNQRAVGRDRAGLRSEQGQLQIQRAGAQRRHAGATGRVIGGAFGGAMDLGMGLQSGGLSGLAGGDKDDGDDNDYGY